MRTTITCKCGKELTYDVGERARRGRCPDCGAVFVVPGAGDAPAKVKADDDQAAGAKPCDGCGASMAADQIVCLICGFNTKLGAKMQTTVEVAPDPVGFVEREGHDGDLWEDQNRKLVFWPFMSLFVTIVGVVTAWGHTTGTPVSLMGWYAMLWVLLSPLWALFLIIRGTVYACRRFGGVRAYISIGFGVGIFVFIGLLGSVGASPQSDPAAQAAAKQTEAHDRICRQVLAAARIINNQGGRMSVQSVELTDVSEKDGSYSFEARLLGGESRQVGLAKGSVKFTPDGATHDIRLSSDLGYDPESLASGLPGSDRRLRVLVAALFDPIDQKAYDAAEQVGDMGEGASSAVGPLIVALEPRPTSLLMTSNGNMTTLYIRTFFSVREAAIVALAKIGPDAIGPLISAMGVDNEPVGSGAASALAQMGSPGVDVLLATVVAGQSPQAGHAAGAAVKVDDPRTEPALLALVRGVDGDSSARSAALDALKQREYAGQVDLCLDLLTDPAMTTEALRVLETINEQPQELVIAAIGDQPNDQRRKLVAALGPDPGGAAVDVLTSIARNDPDALVAAEAVKILVQSRRADARELTSHRTPAEIATICVQLLTVYQAYASASEELVALGDIAVPALITAIETEEDRDLVHRAIRCLEQCKTPEAADTLASLLADPREGVPMAATRALRQMGTVATNSLINELSDEQTRDAAIALLIKIADPVSAGPLAAMLTELPVDQQEKVAALLSKLNNPAAVDGLLALFANDRQTQVTPIRADDWVPWYVPRNEPRAPFVRYKAIAALETLATDEAIGALFALLDAPDHQTRRAASGALYKAENPRKVPLLTAAAPGSPLSALWALSDIKSPESIQALLAVMPDCLSQLRSAQRAHAIRRLDNIDAPGVMDVLALACEDPAMAGQASIMLKLAARKHRSIWDIAQAKRELAQRNKARKIAAVIVLGRSRDPQRLPALAGALRSSHRDVRLAAIKALANVTDPRVAKALVRAAVHPDKYTRLPAQEVVIKTKDPAAFEALIAMIGPSPHTGRAVAILGEMDRQAAGLGFSAPAWRKWWQDNRHRYETPKP